MLEISDYYNFNKSGVGVLLLDSSKAFDGFNYCKLFNELLKRNISPLCHGYYCYVHNSVIAYTLIPCSFMVESSRVENSVAHGYKNI